MPDQDRFVECLHTIGRPHPNGHSRPKRPPPPARARANAAAFLERLVLQLHRRNGGRRSRIPLEWPLLDERLGLDSLDLAEIVSRLELQFHCALFEQRRPPATWLDVVRIASRAQGSASQ